MTQAGMAVAGGNNYGGKYPIGTDTRQLKSRENKGTESPVRFQQADPKRQLAQMRFGSMVAARTKENKMTGARKALMGGNVAGSGAFGPNGIDPSKLGGLTIDPSAPASPMSGGIDDIDKKLNDAVKQAEKQKEEEKLSFWEQLLQDLARQAASAFVGSMMDGFGRSLFGGSNPAKQARRQYGAELAAKGSWENLSATEQAELEMAGYNADKWNNASVKKRGKMGSKTATAKSQGVEQSSKVRQIGQPQVQQPQIQNGNTNGGTSGK